MMKLANHKRMALFSPKIRSKVGSIVSRSRSVSLTSKTIRGKKNSHVIGLLFVTLGLEFLSLSVLALEPVAMRGLFGAVATNRHTAPSSRPPPCAVGEHQRAAMSLARFHVGEVFFTHELRQ